VRESTIFRLRRRWRVLLAGGLSPRAVGAAAALGGGLGVAPIPGLQIAVTALLAWRLRLNLPIALVVSNISFGPLLAAWAAASASVGRWLHTGEPPWRTFACYRADFAAAEGVIGFLHAGGRCMVDWLLGSVVVVPVVAAGCGLVAYTLASVVARWRHPAASGLAIPHAPPMRFAVGAVAGDATAWRVSAVVGADSPAVTAGQVRPAYLVEIAAQAFAAGSVDAGGVGVTAPRAGVLVAVKDWTVHTTVAAGVRIDAEVTPQAALGTLRSALVRLVAGGHPLADGVLHVADGSDPRTHEPADPPT